MRPKGNKQEYRFQINGNQVCVYGATEQECYNQRTEMLQEQKRPKKNTTLIYEKWLTNWFETYKRPYLKSTTIYVMEHHIDIIIKKLGLFDIESLSKEQLQQFLNEQETYSKKRNIKLILNASLDEAFEQGLIEKNPARKLKLPKNNAVHRRALTFDEQNLIISSIDVQKYLSVFKVLCCTGMRVGELMAIDWINDIDYKNGRIHITKNKNIMTGEITTPKTTASKRYIPFLEELAQDLKTIQNENITYNAIRLFFDRLYKRIGIENITIHCFRHTFDSLCYNAKISDKQIQLILGHSTIDMTLNVYTHLMSKGTSPLNDYILNLKKRLDNE